MVPVQVDSWAVAAVVVDEVVVVVVVAVVAEAVEMEPAEITFFISIYVVCLRCAVRIYTWMGFCPEGANGMFGFW